MSPSKSETESKQEERSTLDALDPEPIKLEADEIDEFLEYLFSSIPTKPSPIPLREGAGVARFLMAQAIAQVTGPRARELDQLARMVWGTVFQVSQIETATPSETVRFLRRHAKTYFAGYDIDEIISRIESLTPPRESGGVVRRAGFDVEAHGSVRSQQSTSSQ